MGLNTRVSAVIAAVGLLSVAAATAQQAPSEVGKVLETEGPLGAVIVLRGAQSYALQVGDLLFRGDRVITRSNGGAKLVAGGCERLLDEATSIAIDDDVCEVVPVTLASVAAGTGVVGIAGGGAGVGATPTWVGLLTAGGAAAAAAEKNPSSIID